MNFERDVAWHPGDAVGFAVLLRIFLQQVKFVRQLHISVVEVLHSAITCRSCDIMTSVVLKATWRVHSYLVVSRSIKRLEIETFSC
jgi:hypothetical protein